MYLSAWEVRTGLFTKLHLNWEANTVNAFFMQSLLETATSALITHVVRFARLRQMTAVTAKDVWQSLRTDHTEEIEMKRLTAGFQSHLHAHGRGCKCGDIYKRIKPYASLQSLQSSLQRFIACQFSEKIHHLELFGGQDFAIAFAFKNTYRDIDRHTAEIIGDIYRHSYHTEPALFRIILSYLPYEDLINGPLQVPGEVHAIAYKMVKEQTQRNIETIYCGLWTTHIEEYTRLVASELNFGKDAVLLIHGFVAHLALRFIGKCIQLRTRFPKIEMNRTKLEHILHTMAMRGDVFEDVIDNAFENLEEFNGSGAIINMMNTYGEPELSYGTFFERENEVVTWHHEESEDPDSLVHYEEYTNDGDEDDEQESDNQENYESGSGIDCDMTEISDRN